MLLISGSEPGRRIPQHAAVIDAATAAGVAQLAYVGAFGGPKADFLLADDHRATEQLILDSGLPYTFLRNNWYSEIYTGDLDLPAWWRAAPSSPTPRRAAASPPPPGPTSPRPPRSS